jgi:hypothetical protein
VSTWQTQENLNNIQKVKKEKKMEICYFLYAILEAGPRAGVVVVVEKEEEEDWAGEIRE